MNYELEEYRAIPGYEGLYEISNYGAIRRSGASRGLAKSGMPISQWVRKDGYMQTGIYKNGVLKNYFVHRLVASTFIPNPEGKPTVNHIDGIKTNNCVSNLEWATHKENTHHSFGLPWHKNRKGSERSNSKLTEKDVCEIRERRKTGETYKSIATSFGITRILASYVARGIRWKHV